jgi:hypothetical protein
VFFLSFHHQLNNFPFLSTQTFKRRAALVVCKAASLDFPHYILAMKEGGMVAKFVKLTSVHATKYDACELEAALYLLYVSLRAC